MLRAVRKLLDYGISPKARIYNEKWLKTTKKRLKFIHRRMEKIKKETKETLFFLQVTKDILLRERASVKLTLKQVPEKNKEKCEIYWRKKLKEKNEEKESFAEMMRDVNERRSRNND